MNKEFARIRAIRKRRIGKKDSSSISWTDSEPYALCYYLYNMFDSKSNRRIIDSFDSAIKLFMECTTLLNETERLSKVLKKEIKNLEDKNLLTLLTEPPSGRMCFDDANLPYAYVQDKKIDGEMRHYDSVDENLINLYRILYVSEKPVFSSIINTTLFKNGTDYTLNQEINLSEEIEDAVLDVSKTRFLMDQVKLSEDEARFILMQCRLNTIDLFEDIMRSSNSSDNNFKNRMASMIGLSEKELKYILRGDQKLKTFGFIDSNGNYDSSLNDCIEEQNIEPFFNDLLKPLDCSQAYELESYAVKSESLEICCDLLNCQKPASILFYGKPGSGKTELAKSLCKKTEKNIYVFKNEAENNSHDSYALGRLMCILSMERPDSIIVVDEADSLLKTLQFSFFSFEPSDKKGRVNKMLENNQNKVIYIINHQHQIDESTRRRFTFSIKFEAMPAKMLHSIAESKIAPLNLAEETKEKLLDLLDKYHLTGTSAENLVKVIEGMECKDEDVLLKKAKVLIMENAMLLTGKKKMRDTVKAEYDPKVLNASMNPLKIVNMVENAAKYSEKNKDAENGIRMLFYGLSGTGKTELARYIAEQLGKPILLKRASDILSPFVGNNEQNIRDAFYEAESSDSILLFDEADTFFFNRNQAQKSWERSLVNEFLTQMEEFSGILICTTNLRNIMDPAMHRRFHIMVEFKPMKFEGIKIMAERYFPNFHLSNSQIEELEDSESVTPGDFGSLSSRIRFMNPDDVSSDYIMEELKKLQTEKKNQWKAENGESERKIGFGV